MRAKGVGRAMAQGRVVVLARMKIFKVSDEVEERCRRRVEDFFFFPPGGGQKSRVAKVAAVAERATCVHASAMQVVCRKH